MVKVTERLYGFIKITGNEPVLVTQCFRCFGGLIVCKKKSEVLDDELPECVLFVWHIPPSEDIAVINTSTERIVQKLSAYLDVYEAKEFYRCGGNIDTAYNKRLYDLMKAYLEDPIKSLFPGLPLLGVEPDKKTFYSTILFDENQKVSCTQHGGKHLFKDKVIKEVT